MGVLDLSDDDDTMQTTDTIDITEGVEHKVLIVAHVTGIDLNEEVVVARGIIAFRDLISVPSVGEMVALLRKAATLIPKERLWVNPDCGLKTRAWPETKAALTNMVAAAKTLRS